MTELRPADRDGEEHRPDRRGEQREAPRGGALGAPDEGETAAGDGLALSVPDRVAHAQARALWSALLDPGQAGGLSEAELGRAWTVAQCWRSVDPKAERAADLAEQQLWNRRPDVMQRYGCLTAVGADHIEATLRVAPSLDRPAPSASPEGRGSDASATTESTIHPAGVRRLITPHLLPPVTVQNLTLARPVPPNSAGSPTTVASTASAPGPRRQG
jgi:hypothetical protein